MGQRDHQDDGETRSLLGFESGGERWLIDLADAGEVLPVPELNKVPLTKPWFLGVANIRGTLYGVTDLAAFHGGAPTAIQAQSRLLLTRTQARGNPGSNIALLMAATYGLKAGLKPLTEPEVVAAAVNTEKDRAQPWRGDCYCDGDGQTWIHLLLSKLVGAAEFLNIAA